MTTMNNEQSTFIFRVIFLRKHAFSNINDVSV